MCPHVIVTKSFVSFLYKYCYNFAIKKQKVFPSGTVNEDDDEFSVYTQEDVSETVLSNSNLQFGVFGEFLEN